LPKAASRLVQIFPKFMPPSASLFRYAPSVNLQINQTMQYEEPPVFTRLTIADLESNDPSVVCNAILSICLNSGDYKLAINSVTKCLGHKNEFVLGCGIICIGHIARIWGQIPNDFIYQVQSALTHQSDFVKGHAVSALDDINFFVNASKSKDDGA
jgi:hypothetical protein